MSVNRAADNNVSKLATAYVGSLQVLRQGVNREVVRVALERNDPGMAVAAFPWDAWAGVLGRMLLPRIQETMRQAGEGVGRRTVVRKDFRLFGLFDIKNPRAIRIASEIAARLVTRVTEATKWSMRQVIADAQANGVSVRDQASRLADILVEQAGLDAPRSRALDKYRASLAQQGMRPDLLEQRVGRMRDQLIMDRARTIARHECLVPESLVDTAVVRAASRRPYAGDIADVVTRGGRKLSATPNHPVLTKRGWVGAGFLNPGDELICYRGQQDLGAVGDSYEVHGPAAISEVFEALKVGGTHYRTATTHADFHGDGMESEVNVLRAYGLLRVGRFASLDKPLLDDLLAPAHMVGARFCRCQHLLGVNKAECLCERPLPDAGFGQRPEDFPGLESEGLGDVSGGLAALVAFDRVYGLGGAKLTAVMDADSPTAVAGLQGLGMAARHAGPRDCTLDPFDTAPDLLGHLPAAHASEIEFDSVISVGLRSWSGHVYNLETAYGYFTVQGIYTGNTQDAAVAGQAEVWEQAVEQGLLPTGIMQEWLTAPTVARNRVCPICKDMNGQRVKRGQLFVSPYDGSTHARPPAHIQCRCSLVLVDPLDEVGKYDTPKEK